MRPSLPLFLLAFVSVPLIHAAAPDSGVPKPAEVLSLMEQAADWQLANPSKAPVDGWVQAAGYTGFMALADLSAKPKYVRAMEQMAEKNSWKPASRIYHADDHCVTQTYSELFFRRGNPAMLAPTIERLDYILAHPKDNNLEFVGKEKNDRWAWCDSLYMGPPAWVRLWAATGKQAYLDYAVTNWWKTSAYLYDKDEHLYYRDSTFFKSREANDKKVFWSRGNGWVIGGLVRVLEYLPADHPARAKFEQQFREMSARLIELQQPDGFWHASLLDPTSYPEKEESGTGFFCYGLAWGINQGLLDRATYLPATLKAWNSLTGCVQPDGKVIHVQPIGADPKKFAPTSTEPYGVGSFLLAGSEIYRLGVNEGTTATKITVQNPTEKPGRFAVALDQANDGNVVVTDGSKAAVLPTMKSGDNCTFSTWLTSRENRAFCVLPASAVAAVPPAEKAGENPLLKAQAAAK
jgi:unsaturated rhamnogalacturonyl hydrolase